LSFAVLVHQLLELGASLDLEEHLVVVLALGEAELTCDLTFKWMISLFG
jgi:hypothetical protein